MKKIYLVSSALLLASAVFAQSSFTAGNNLSTFIRSTKTAQKSSVLLKNQLTVPADIPDSIANTLYQYECVRNPNITTKYLIIITLDGMRWQEIFNGPDKEIMAKNAGLHNDYCTSGNPIESRAALMPFLWNKIVPNGFVVGNAAEGSVVKVSNRYKISYPGYSEIFTGMADDQRIKSNFNRLNPNENVLEFIQQTKGFENRVASFSSWRVFPGILNIDKTSFLIDAAFENTPQKKGYKSSPWGKKLRPDSITFQKAMVYLQHALPRVLHIGLGETDEYGHQNQYEAYLDAAHHSDKMIEKLWTFIQQHPLYAGRTTLLITTDHGRGKRRDNWNKHHLLVEGSGDIWMAMIGPDTPKIGEFTDHPDIVQAQLAQTFAEILGLRFESSHAVAPGIPTLFSGIKNKQNQQMKIPRTGPSISDAPLRNQ